MSHLEKRRDATGCVLGPLTSLHGADDLPQNGLVLNTLRALCRHNDPDRCVCLSKNVACQGALEEIVSEQGLEEKTGFSQSEKAGNKNIQRSRGRVDFVGPSGTLLECAVVSAGT